MSRRKLENDIKNDLKGIGWEFFDWIILTHFREKWRALVSSVMNFMVP
jgi:hypothetical protein